MIKILTKQISRHPIGFSFLMFGYIVSLLIISIGTSSIVEMKQLALARTEGMPKNALTISANANTKVNFNKYLELFNNIKSDSNLIFLGMRTYIDNSEKDKIYDLTCEFFTQMPNWSYPLLNGHYYTPDDIKSSRKVALLGKDLAKYTVNHNNVKNIKISGEQYEVIGFIGRNGQKTPWDSRIFIPITSIPESCKTNLLEPLFLNCILYNSNSSTMDDFKKINENILKLDNKSSISVNELSSKNDVIANNFGSNGKLIFMSVLIFITALINSINITSCWINDRKREIGIRKAFGNTNFNISVMLITEILSINLISSLISLIIQYMLGLFVDNVHNIPLNMSIENFLVAIFMVIISSLITSIIPIYKSLRVQPIEALKV